MEVFLHVRTAVLGVESPSKLGVLRNPFWVRLPDGRLYGPTTDFVRFMGGALGMSLRPSK